jgi:hypothetical protein
LTKGEQYNKYHFTPYESIVSSFFKKEPPKSGYKLYVRDNNLDEKIETMLEYLFADERLPLNNYHLTQYIKFIEGFEETDLTDSILIKFIEALNPNEQTSNILEEIEIYLKDVFCPNKDPITTNVVVSMLMKKFISKLSNRIYEINRINDKFSIILLNTIVDSFPKYSLYPCYEGDISPNIHNIRKMLQLAVLKLLNDGVWNKDGRGQNSLSNIKFISYYILGCYEEGIKSIIEKLGKNRGILGIYDMLSICYIFIRTEYWEIQKSLYWHGLKQSGRDNITDQDVLNIDLRMLMEEVNVMALSIFKELYIDNGKNVFEDFTKIEGTDLVGGQASSISDWFGLIKSEEIFDSLVEIIKSELEIIVIYDLCSDFFNDNTYRCGYYFHGDTKIKDIMQDYLFEVCFKVSEKNPDAYKYFVNYLLKNYVRMRGGDNWSYGLKFEEIQKTLDKDTLLQYLDLNHEDIKDYFEGKEGAVKTYNYTATYKEDLTNQAKTGLFDILENELKNSKSNS